MAADTFTGAGWIPVETNAEVIQAVQQASAVEAFGNHVSMGSQTKWTPRTGGVTMARWAKGSAAAVNDNGNDSVLLNADKFGAEETIAEEDLTDSMADTVKAKTIDAATSYGKLFDNVTLGITAAKGTSGWGFDSLYYLLTQNDTVVGYTANANLTLAGTGGITYDNLSTSLGLYEQGNYFDPANTVVIAHPMFAQILRGIKDTAGAPIFNESSNGTAGGGQGGTPSLFGHTLQWSLGARTSAAGSDAPTGNPFIVFGNRRLLQVGDRDPLATKFIDTNGIGARTDENVLLFRARKAFAPGAVNAFSMLVKN
jgi:HK97 family phage major capsid protein